LPWKGWPALL